MNLITLQKIADIYAVFCVFFKNKAMLSFFCDFFENVLTFFSFCDKENQKYYKNSWIVS